MCAMNKAALLSILVVAVLLTVEVFAQAQQPTRIPRIGYLIAVSPSTSANRIKVFQQGLRELGYTEKNNIVI